MVLEMSTGAMVATVRYRIPNIFDSLVACESAADATGLDKTQCIQIDDENAPGTLCATPH